MLKDNLQKNEKQVTLKLSEFLQNKAEFKALHKSHLSSWKPSVHQVGDYIVRVASHANGIAIFIHEKLLPHRKVNSIVIPSHHFEFAELVSFKKEGPLDYSFIFAMIHTYHEEPCKILKIIWRKSSQSSSLEKFTIKERPIV